MAEKTYRSRRELVVLAFGGLFIFLGLGIASNSLLIGTGFSNPANRTIAVFGSLTSLFFVGISIKLACDLRPNYRFSKDQLIVIVGKSVKDYPWSDLQGYEAMGAAFGEFRLRFRQGLVWIPFQNLRDGEELHSAIIGRLTELGKDKQTPPAVIESVFEGRWILLGCMALLNFLPLALLKRTLEERHWSDLKLTFLFLLSDIGTLLYFGRSIKLVDGILTRISLLGRKQIILDQAIKIKLDVTYGKAGAFERTRIEDVRHRITFSSADSYYVALRDRSLELAKNAEVVDQRPPSWKHVDPGPSA